MAPGMVAMYRPPAIRQRPARKVRQHCRDAIHGEQVAKLRVSKPENFKKRWPKKPRCVKRQTEHHFTGDDQRNYEEYAAHQSCVSSMGVGG
jgi:hypothetical protein